MKSGERGPVSVRWFQPFEAQTGFLARFEAASALNIDVTPNYKDPQIGDRLPTLAVAPTADAVWLGPLFPNEGGPCASCLRFWLSLHWWRRSFPAESQSLIDWARTEKAVMTAVVEWERTGELPDLVGAMLRIDNRSGAVDRVVFSSCRDCSTCGFSSLLPTLDSLANPFTGILEDLRICSDDRTGLSFAHAGAVCPLPNQPGRPKWKPLPVSGTGVSVHEAMMTLVMESAERHSAIYTGSEPILSATVQELKNAKSPFFSQDAGVCHWVRSRTILEGTPCYVPAGLAYLGYCSPDEPLSYVADSNGCASGYSMEGALYRALLEVIERDAIAIWWFNRIRREGLDARADPVIARVTESLRSRNRTLHLVLVTTDIGIPVVAALSAAANGSKIYVGAAADPNTLQAARRAAFEMMQFLFWGTRQEEPIHRRKWLDEATLQDQSWLVPENAVLCGDTGDTSPSQAKSQWVTAFLARAGFCPLWIDLTRPHLQIPVVRAIVPGLCMLSRNVSPSRLLRNTAQQTHNQALNPYDPPI